LSLLSDLLDQIHCDGVWLFHLDSRREAARFLQYLPDDEDDEDDGQVFWEHYWDCAPCSYPDRSADLRSITRISDFYSARQWHATGMYNDYFRPGGIEHELMLCLPPGRARTAGPGQSVRLLLSRGPGPDFSERDRALLTLLRPHLHQAYLDAEYCRARTSELTPRQWELLHLVAAGHTNTQIARRLGLSEGTVRKHLENIYSRLHVSSRTAAVTHAFPSSDAT
jgi:DNA-binding CsgD family transcriptional regulator